MIGATRAHVCIIEPEMKQYRVPFFLELQRQLEASGIGLTVVYGRPSAAHATRGDSVDLAAPLGRAVRSRYFGPLLWMPVLKPWWQADLVIVEQANKHALNYLLHALREAGAVRLAYWGHGRDFQGDPRTLGERWKRHLLPAVDWWFAYNDLSRDHVVAQGFPAARVTSVQNALDTRGLCAEAATLTADERQAALAALGWGPEVRIGISCGSLYANKRVDRLIRDSRDIHAAHPSFRLLVIGGGPDAAALRTLAADAPWVRLVGPRFGRELAVLLSLGTLWLNPGLVGLGVLQAFCAGLPLITHDVPFHSPEIAYVQHGFNGLVLPDHPAAFTQAVVALLSDPARLAALQHGARVSAGRWSVEAMAAHFRDGIAACLGLTTAPQACTP